MEAKKSNNLPWVYSPWFDLLFILLPPFICLVFILLFAPYFLSNPTENPWIWLLIVVGVDVGHVYSTIYRTYLETDMVKKNKLLFYYSPIALYIIGVLLHSTQPVLFWRTMTYLAVFHFIRQQYGFMRLYSRNEIANKWSKRIDQITIYSTTLYPLLYWHLSGPQPFNWFIDNDFIYFNHPQFIPFFTNLYLLVLSVYLCKETIRSKQIGQLNVPKQLLVLGTAVSWYFGIVVFKGDLTFTLLNVISHGIPYYALVWAYGNKQQLKAPTTINKLSRFFQPKNILLFFGLLFLLAYVEEYLWDGLVWKEHPVVFPLSKVLPNLTDHSDLLSLLVPLLALPQIMHYFIDGFIWKINKDRFGWVSVLFTKKS